MMAFTRFRAHLLIIVQVAGAALIVAGIFAGLLKLMSTMLRQSDDINILDGDIHVKGRVYADGGFHTITGSDGSENGSVPLNVTSGTVFANVTIWRAPNVYVNVGDELDTIIHQLDNFHQIRQRRKLRLETCKANIDISKTGTGAQVEKRLLYVEGLLACFIMADQAEDDAHSDPPLQRKKPVHQ
jgi:hypothetical protein